MYDAIFVATIIGFFGLCVAYIAACDRIIGPDSEFELELAPTSDGEPAPVVTPPAERAA
jgi:hypothetical protein